MTLTSDTGAGEYATWENASLCRMPHTPPAYAASPSCSIAHPSIRPSSSHKVLRKHTTIHTSHTIHPPSHTVYPPSHTVYPPRGLWKYTTLPLGAIHPPWHTQHLSPRRVDAFGRAADCRPSPPLHAVHPSSTSSGSLPCGGLWKHRTLNPRRHSFTLGHHPPVHTIHIPTMPCNTRKTAKAYYHSDNHICSPPVLYLTPPAPAALQMLYHPANPDHLCQAPRRSERRRLGSG
ncbi:hypothetical protein CC85DRAFT_21649 [Cutaneotrichosporon oleaginosum]|uniref:Uncharacterized protein n=1 Tax=Cutaneotrichosporon oleaginosum TaxID=879819 RepID=A0A0J0XC04_9TREE|nr:uncharacterized protein CC85DRAFT_21649 [Cutaneotrichosporon oleaginosum]KLT38601.1 hypothetical protein CC85DRAFT_21649 [Cutaneotrichosporon oleaginosum]TXT05801.1 hypothetical protein COLE_07121 [Cutaneotrichosporon oleaginosum]